MGDGSLTWWCAREKQLDRHPNQIHVAETSRPDRQCSGGRKNEDDNGAEEWRSEVNDAIGQPCRDIEDGVLMSGKNITEVSPVEDILQGGQDLDPDRRTVGARDKTTSAWSAILSSRTSGSTACPLHIA